MADSGLEDLFLRSGAVGTEEFASPVGAIFDFLCGEAPFAGPHLTIDGIRVFGPDTYDRHCWLQYAKLTAVCRWWGEADKQWGEGP